MGCISSKKDINDIHPNIFQVTNVDDGGRANTPGQLEVTENDLVFHQRGKDPVHWPLRCLRKYGFDIEIFSFECGRRCSTGQGIYAFHSLKAERLFNIVQQNIQLQNVMDDNLHLTDFPIPLATTGPPVQRRISQADNYLNSSNNHTIRSHQNLSRPGSIASNGPISPPIMLPLCLAETNFEQNNNKRDSVVLEHSYTNTGTTIEDENLELPSYINVTMSNNTLPETCINMLDSSNHLYMNVSCSNVNRDLHNEEKYDINSEYAGHCYANIDTTESENLNPISRNIDSESVANTPIPLLALTKEVNYAELDLADIHDASRITLESPVKIKSYVTIDFNKTNALSQSVNPRIGQEEGSRKTRHNSNISDIPTRHSSSLSD